MAGEQSYDKARGYQKENQLAAGRQSALQALMSGDTQGAMAQALGAGDTQGATAISNYVNQTATRDYQNRSLAETSRHNQASEKNAADNQDSVKILPLGGGIVDRSGKVLREPGLPGSGANDTSTEIAARQLISGDMSGLKNRGRGAQGAQEINAIRNKAAEILTLEHGMNPADAATHISSKVQQFNASGIGQNAEARTGATREANLNIILKATEAAIPAALEASAAVARTGWVPINQIIQKGQIAASSPELRKFGMANLQLAEHWARAMNPTGVMRESDRDKALEFLNTADSPSTYASLVGQLRTQITRERDAIKSGLSHNPLPPGEIKDPAIQGQSSNFGGNVVGASAAPATVPQATSTGVQWRVVQ